MSKRLASSSLPKSFAVPSIWAMFACGVMVVPSGGPLISSARLLATVAEMERDCEQTSHVVYVMAAWSAPSRSRGSGALLRSRDRVRILRVAGEGCSALRHGVEGRLRACRTLVLPKSLHCSVTTADECPGMISNLGGRFSVLGRAEGPRRETLRRDL